MRVIIKQTSITLGAFSNIVVSSPWYKWSPHQSILYSYWLKHQPRFMVDSLHRTDIHYTHTASLVNPPERSRNVIWDMGETMYL